MQDNSNLHLTTTYLIDETYKPIYEDSSTNTKIVKTKRFGDALFMENILQSTKKDEYIYHEMLVHSLLSCLKDPKKVLILGGAEGCTVREVLKWSSVTHVTMVDYNKPLVDYFKSKEGEAWNQGAFLDSRVTVIHDEALSWLLNKNTIKYDAIIVDLFDPITESDILFLEKLCGELKDHMHADSGIVVNGGNANLSAINTLTPFFTNLFENDYYRNALHVFVPSFMAEWCLFLITPMQWSNILQNNLSKIPCNLKRFDFLQFTQASIWSSDISLEMKQFLANRCSKKLTSEIVAEAESVLSYYGC